jgi:hypothetical protein
MRRIIGRDIYIGKMAPEHEVTIHDLGHGHKEVSICRSVWWEHDTTMTPEAYALYLESLEAYRNSPAGEQEALERAQANLERSARRAKTQCRRLVKVMGLDALLTLTYRENMQDLEACKRHLKEFVRRIRRVIPGFAYVAAFEQQKRGAWHVHMAVHALPFNLAWAGVKVKSYSVVRAVWRGVVGELGGNIDQSKRKRGSRATPAKIASYISKYMLKSFDLMGADFERYSASKADIPPPVRLRFMHQVMQDLIALVYIEAGASELLTSPWLNPWGDRFFLVMEPAPPDKNRP